MWYKDSRNRKVVRMSLSIKVVESRPRVFTITLVGKLDTTTYAALEQKIQYLMKEGEAKVLTLNLAGLEFISSMGIRVIFKAIQDMNKAGGSLYMAEIPPHISKALEIIDALPSMKIFSSMQEMDAYLAKMQQH